MTSNDVLKAKLQVLASVKMHNRYFKKALNRKSNNEKTLRSKLLSAKIIINKNNSMIKKMTQENLSLKQGSHHSEAKQLKRSPVALRYTYHKSKISYKMNEQKWKKENKDLKEKMHYMKIENQSQLEELACKEESSKRINSKNDGKTYNVACHKAVYCCLEYHVPITNISPVIE